MNSTDKENIEIEKADNVKKENSSFNKFSLFLFLGSIVFFFISLIFPFLFVMVNIISILLGVLLNISSIVVSIIAIRKDRKIKNILVCKIVLILSSLVFLFLFAIFLFIFIFFKDESSTENQLENLKKLENIEEIVLTFDDTVDGWDHMHLHNRLELYFSDGKFIKADGTGEKLDGHNFRVVALGNKSVGVYVFRPENESYFDSVPTYNYNVFKYFSKHKASNLYSALKNYDKLYADIEKLPEYNPEDLSFLENQKESKEFYFQLPFEPEYLREKEVLEDLKRQKNVKTIKKIEQKYEFEENYAYEIEMNDGSLIEFVTTAVKKERNFYDKENSIYRKNVSDFRIKKFNGKELKIHKQDWTRLKIYQYFSNYDMEELSGTKFITYSIFFENWEFYKNKMEEVLKNVIISE